MAPELSRQIRQEVDLIERFVASYRHKFAELIEQLNRGPSTLTDLQSLRLCVEAVDMMLLMQGHLAQALQKISALESPRQAA